jgi:hypothetical protein
MSFLIILADGGDSGAFSGHPARVQNSGKAGSKSAHRRLRLPLARPLPVVKMSQ